MALGRPTFDAARHRRVFVPVVIAIAGIAWVALWVWGQSPYARYLEHGNWIAADPAAFLCRILPAGPVLVPILAYTLGWLLMIVAMMLPTTLPLVDSFDRMTAGRADHRYLIALVCLGYLAVWSAFGLVAHPLHGALLAFVDRVPVLAINGWLIGAAIIALAGAFQFSNLKYRCLEKCRTPLSFVIAHWHGRRPARDAFVLGAHHGLFCLGCCWALMLVMFAVGTGSLGWMLVIGAVMAIEKNVRWGRRLSAPLGAALFAWSMVMVAAHP